MQVSCDASGNNCEDGADDGGVPEEPGEAAISGPSQIGHEGKLNNLTAKAVKRSEQSSNNVSDQRLCSRHTCSDDEQSTVSESKE